MGKFLDKLKKYKDNIRYDPRYTTFLLKLQASKSKAHKFFFETLKFKYPVAIWFYTKSHIYNFFYWSFDILVSGSLIWVTVTGILNPIHTIHTIIAYGLALYIPTNYAGKIYSRITYDRNVRARISLPNMPGGIQR